MDDLQTSIINEEDDHEENPGSQMKMGGSNDFLRLNEQSVNVELDTSRGMNNMSDL